MPDSSKVSVLVEPEADDVIEWVPVTCMPRMRDSHEKVSQGSNRVTVHTRAAWRGCLTRAVLPFPSGPLSRRTTLVIVGVIDGHCSMSSVSDQTRSTGAAMSTVSVRITIAFLVRASGGRGFPG